MAIQLNPYPWLKGEFICTCHQPCSTKRPPGEFAWMRIDSAYGAYFPFREPYRIDHREFEEPACQWDREVDSDPPNGVLLAVLWRTWTNGTGTPLVQSLQLASGELLPNFFFETSPVITRNVGEQFDCRDAIDMQAHFNSDAYPDAFPDGSGIDGIIELKWGSAAVDPFGP